MAKRAKTGGGVAFYLMTIGNLIAKNTAQHTLKGSSLSVNYWRALRFFALARSGTATDVVTALGMDKTTVSRVITHLHSAGLISLTPNPGDRRQTLVSLTAAGRRVHDRIYPADRACDASFEEKLTPSEARFLLPILAKLHAHARALLEGRTGG